MKITLTMAAGGMLCLLLFGGTVGCEGVAALAYASSRAPMVPAEFTPLKTPTLVRVEKGDNPGEVPIASDQIAQMVSHQLTLHSVAPLADPSPLLELRSRNPDKYRMLSAIEAGRLVDARQVIDIDLSEFTITDALATELVRGKVTCQVRVYDVETGKTLWPSETSMGKLVSFEDPYGGGRAGNSTADALRKKMCEDLSLKIGKLFFTYRSDTIDGTEPSLSDAAR